MAERPGDERWGTTNDVAGISGLVERLKAGGALRLIVLEATGGYEIAVVAALAAEGLPVVVINARQVRAFARAVGKLAKTDAIDATVLAHFAEAVRPEARPLASEAAQGLAELVGRRRQLVEMIGMETNRRHSARNPKVLRGIARTLKALETGSAGRGV